MVMIMDDNSNGTWGHRNFLATFAGKSLLSLYEGLATANWPFLTLSSVWLHTSLTFTSVTWSPIFIILVGRLWCGGKIQNSLSGSKCWIQEVTCCPLCNLSGISRVLWASVRQTLCIAKLYNEFGCIYLYCYLWGKMDRYDQYQYNTKLSGFLLKI